MGCVLHEFASPPSEGYRAYINFCSVKAIVWAAVAALTVLTSCATGQPDPAPDSTSTSTDAAIALAEATATALPALPPPPPSPPAVVESAATTPPAQAPRTRPAPQTSQAAPSSRCDSNYTGACVPIASDVDCEGGTGNGPAYASRGSTVIRSGIVRHIAVSRCGPVHTSVSACRSAATRNGNSLMTASKKRLRGSPPSTALHRFRSAPASSAISPQRWPRQHTRPPRRSGRGGCGVRLCCH